MSERFWRWLKDYANRKAAAYHKHSRKCPNCFVWTAEVGGCESLEDEGLYFELMTCKQCGYVSRWDCTPMLPMLHHHQPMQPGGVYTRATRESDTG